MTFAWHLKRLYNGFKEFIVDQTRLIVSAPVQTLFAYLLLLPTLVFGLFLFMAIIAGLFQGGFADWTTGEKPFLHILKDNIYDLWSFLTYFDTFGLQLAVQFICGLGWAVLISKAQVKAYNSKSIEVLAYLKILNDVIQISKVIAGIGGFVLFIISADYFVIQSTNQITSGLIFLLFFIIIITPCILGLKKFEKIEDYIDKRIVEEKLKLDNDMIRNKDYTGKF